MKQNDLARAVARVTGESVHHVKRLGFLLEPEPSDCTQVEVLDIQVIDWDVLEQTGHNGLSSRRKCREADTC